MEAADPDEAPDRPGAQQWVPRSGRGSVSRLRQAATACRGCELYRDATHRAPDLAHLTACRPWLDEELRVVHPDVVVGLGAIATRALLGSRARVTQLRGQVLETATNGSPRVVVTPHPSAVLRMRGADREAGRAGLVADLRLARESLGQPG